MRAKFLDLLAQEIPFKSRSEIEALVSPELISEFTLELPQSLLTQAEHAVDAFFAWREHPASIAHFQAEAEKRGLKDPGNFAICMSYDFHRAPDDTLKLIEINTNAAFQGLAWPLYESQGLPWPVAGYNPNELRRSIEEELQLSAPANSQGPWLVLDENPTEQKLRIEFDFFLAQFRKWGYDARLADLQDVTAKDRFVYNRYTDFYFEEEKSKALRELYLSKTTTFSPHPFEYLALADKERLREMTADPSTYRDRVSPAQAGAIESALLKSEMLTRENAEANWAHRKQLFFKPLRAYGGKQTYRGSSVSRKVFEGLIGEDILAQEYCPPPEARFETPDGPQDFKYDLRFYAYKGRVQGAIARLYQGQLTNMRTKYGGFTCVRFV